MDYEEAKKILSALEREQVEYTLIGAMAMAAQGLVRATRDIDLFLAPNRSNVNRLKKALSSLYSDPSIMEITAEDLLGEYPAIEYTPPHGRFSIDIITRLGTAFCYDDIEQDEVHIEGTTVYVATPKTLYRMKKNTIRPRDAIDAAWIRDFFEIEDDSCP